MRIAVLCNDRLGLPALQQLVQNRLLQAVGASDRSPEIISIMNQVSAQAGVPSQIFTRKNFEGQLMIWLDQHKPDVVLVKTFPFRIPAAALNVPKFGFINFHYAPLPQFRGSNPLFWMIRNRVEIAGVTIHRMDEQFDTGPILLRHEFPLSPEATFGMLTSELAFGGAALTSHLLQGLAAGTLKEEIQQVTEATSWGRPKPADLFINWKTMSQVEILALIRACNPWNKGAPTRFRGWMFAITDASAGNLAVPAGTVPGTILAISPGKGITIACADGKSLQAEVAYAEEGFFEAGKLLQLGLQPGNVLEG